MKLSEQELQYLEKLPPYAWAEISFCPNESLVDFVIRVLKVSKTKARALIDQGGVRATGLNVGDRVRIGKGRFYKIV